MHTDASHRFERGTDPRAPLDAASRAVALLASKWRAASSPAPAVDARGEEVPTTALAARRGDGSTPSPGSRCRRRRSSGSWRVSASRRGPSPAVGKGSCPAGDIDEPRRRVRSSPSLRGYAAGSLRGGPPPPRARQDPGDAPLARRADAGRNEAHAPGDADPPAPGGLRSRRGDPLRFPRSRRRCGVRRPGAGRRAARARQPALRPLRGDAALAAPGSRRHGRVQSRPRAQVAVVSSSSATSSRPAPTRSKRWPRSSPAARRRRGTATHARRGRAQGGLRRALRRARRRVADARRPSSRAWFRAPAPSGRSTAPWSAASAGSRRPRRACRCSPASDPRPAPGGGAARRAVEAPFAGAGRSRPT